MFREDEHNPSMMYNYDGDYDARSIFSEGSYFEDQHGTLTEVLGYCQAMYDIVQRLDKKMDMLQRKVSEIRHNQIKPHFKPKPMGFPAKGPHLLSHRKIRLHKSPRVPSSHMRPASQQPYNHSLRMRAEDRTLCHPAVLRSVPSVPLSREPEQCVQRQSPPLPTIISTHSFQPPISVINARTAENRPPQTVLESYSKNDCVSYQIVNESLTSTPATLTTPEANARETDNSNLLDVPLHRSLRSDSPPTSSVPADSSYAYLGNPKRNVSIPGGCLMKARKKTKPLYAARYLLRILSYKEISNCGLEGSDEPGAKILDSNKISAVRGMLAFS
ncbi:hypothetical protein GDO86_003799 [Hymenochirus boettgeri]|uniref:BEN domain-containing protein n=1 Tax=Hymenochirus boettgeri TaxID=247094 RepID=A0A8T2K337_9PIPI|nr:hypothetical protein GDO86_003799 [Hymenochirus boettgeri]